MAVPSFFASPGTDNVPCLPACSTGEVAACVADVEAVESHLTPSLLTPKLASVLPNSCLLVVDTNLTEQALSVACRAAAAADVPVFLEPVSVPKSARAAGSLRHVTFVTPNADELVAIAEEVRACRSQQYQQQVTHPGIHASPTNHRAPQGGGGGEARELISRLVPHAAVLLQEGGVFLALMHSFMECFVQFTQHSNSWGQHHYVKHCALYCEVSTARAA